MSCTQEKDVSPVSRKSSTSSSSCDYSDVIILDGGMGRLLQNMGAPFKQPQWSAAALMDAPHYVREAHERYVKAGAQVLTTNAYAVVPFHVGEKVFREQGEKLCRRAAQIAREVADKANATPGRAKVQVAASVSPALGSYRPEAFDEELARQIWPVLIDSQADLSDFFLVETLSSIAETKLAIELCAKHGKPIWVSSALQDDRPLLRSNETVSEWIDAVCEADVNGLVQAVLFNCSQLEVMEDAVREAAAHVGPHGPSYRVGVYANAFFKPPTGKRPDANETLMEIRTDISPGLYAKFATRWVSAGASIIGGCCGIGPAHIAKLCERFASAA